MILYIIIKVIIIIVCCFVCRRNLRDLFHIGDRAVIYVFIAASYTPWLVIHSFVSFNVCVYSQFSLFCVSFNIVSSDIFGRNTLLRVSLFILCKIIYTQSYPKSKFEFCIIVSAD